MIGGTLRPMWITMKQALAATAPGTNLQSMIFWPSRRSLALATGTVPAARGAFTIVAFGRHFARLPQSTPPRYG